MIPWYERWRDWEGTADQLVEAVGRIVGEHVPDEEFAPNVRLLRHYQSIGAVSRPERRGKEAIYGYRQLLEVMAVRTLVLDGWPLAKIAEMTSSASKQELLGILPAAGYGRRSDSRNTAQDLVARFARESGRELRQEQSSLAQDADDIDDLRAPPGSTDAASLSSVGPGMRELVELEPMLGVRVSVSREDLQRFGTRDIRALGDAVERALTEARRRVRGGKDDD